MLFSYCTYKNHVRINAGVSSCPCPCPRSWSQIRCNPSLYIHSSQSIITISCSVRVLWVLPLLLQCGTYYLITADCWASEHFRAVCLNTSLTHWHQWRWWIMPTFLRFSSIYMAYSVMINWSHIHFDFWQFLDIGNLTAKILLLPSVSDVWVPNGKCRGTVWCGNCCANYSRPSGVCRYGRLLYSAPVFFLFFYLMNLRKNGRTLFGAKYGRT